MGSLPYHHVVIHPCIHCTHKAACTSCYACRPRGLPDCTVSLKVLQEELVVVKHRIGWPCAVDDAEPETRDSLHASGAEPA